ncbi:MAG: hypothetical protein ACREBU_04835 [Nitrososphaera sp.]
MSSIARKPALSTLLKTYRLILIGVILLSIGVPLWVVGPDLIEAQSVCAYEGGSFPPGRGEFIPGASFEETCSVSRDYGQDLTFWTRFRDHQSGEVIPIPAKVEIRDPNNTVIINQDFNEGIIIVYVKPNLLGNYKVTITSLEDPNNRVTRGAPIIQYAFGFLTSNGYEGVNNPVGTAVESMLVFGNLMIIAGIAIIILGAVQRSRRK